jgi:hypothetical protein
LLFLTLFTRKKEQANRQPLFILNACTCGIY